MLPLIYVNNPKFLLQSETIFSYLFCARAETSSSSEDEISTKPPRHRRRISSGARDTPTSQISEIHQPIERDKRSQSREKQEVRDENGGVENVTSPSAGVSQGKPKVPIYIHSILLASLF